MRSSLISTGVLLLLGCGCSTRPWARSHAVVEPLSIAEASGVLLDKPIHWSNIMRATAVFAGTLRIDSAELKRIGNAKTPDTYGMAGEQDWGWFAELKIEDGKCLLGGRVVPESISPKVWIEERDERLKQLSELNGERVWFGWRKDTGIVGGLDGLHSTADRQQHVAVMSVMRAPLADLAAPVAEASRRVEDVKRELAAGRMGGQDALDRLRACDATLLPGLLHAMHCSLQERHLEEGVVGRGFVQIDGYNTTVRCSFDVFCLLSQHLRGFLSGATSNDDDRAAEVRALAVGLRLGAWRGQ